MNVEKIEYDPASKHLNLRYIVKMAMQHAADISQILENPGRFPNSAKIEALRTAIGRKDIMAILAAAHTYIQAQYLTEDQEQFIRPIYFAAAGGDCDDQAIFMVALAYWLGIPPEHIAVVEGGDLSGFTHLFTQIILPNGEAISIDGMPGAPFGQASTPVTKAWSIPEIGAMSGAK